MSEGVEGVHRPEVQTFGYQPALDGVRASRGAMACSASTSASAGCRAATSACRCSSPCRGSSSPACCSREHRGTGRVDLPAFYQRRARRLIPAGLLVLGAGLRGRRVRSVRDAQHVPPRRRRQHVPGAQLGAVARAPELRRPVHRTVAGHPLLVARRGRAVLRGVAVHAGAAAAVPAPPRRGRATAGRARRAVGGQCHRRTAHGSLVVARCRLLRHLGACLGGDVGRGAGGVARPSSMPLVVGGLAPVALADHGRR